jgi:hypothetical protein
MEAFKPMPAAVTESIVICTDVEGHPGAHYNVTTYLQQGYFGIQGGDFEATRPAALEAYVRECAKQRWVPIDGVVVVFIVFSWWVDHARKTTKAGASEYILAAACKPVKNIGQFRSIFSNFYARTQSPL